MGAPLGDASHSNRMPETESLAPAKAPSSGVAKQSGLGALVGSVMHVATELFTHLPALSAGLDPSFWPTDADGLRDLAGRDDQSLAPQLQEMSSGAIDCQKMAPTTSTHCRYDHQVVLNLGSGNTAACLQHKSKTQCEVTDLRQSPDLSSLSNLTHSSRLYVVGHSNAGADLVESDEVPGWFSTTKYTLSADKLADELASHNPKLKESPDTGKQMLTISLVACRTASDSVGQKSFAAKLSMALAKKGISAVVLARTGAIPRLSDTEKQFLLRTNLYNKTVAVGEQQYRHQHTGCKWAFHTAPSDSSPLRTRAKVVVYDTNDRTLETRHPIQAAESGRSHDPMAIADSKSRAEQLISGAPLGAVVIFNDAATGKLQLMRSIPGKGAASSSTGVSTLSIHQNASRLPREIDRLTDAVEGRLESLRSAGHVVESYDEARSKLQRQDDAVASWVIWREGDEWQFLALLPGLTDRANVVTLHGEDLYAAIAAQQSENKSISNCYEQAGKLIVSDEDAKAVIKDNKTPPGTWLLSKESKRFGKYCLRVKDPLGGHKAVEPKKFLRLEQLLPAVRDELTRLEATEELMDKEPGTAQLLRGDLNHSDESGSVTLAIRQDDQKRPVIVREFKREQKIDARGWPQEGIYLRDGNELLSIRDFDRKYKLGLFPSGGGPGRWAELGF